MWRFARRRRDLAAGIVWVESAAAAIDASPPPRQNDQQLELTVDEAMAVYDAIERSKGC